MMTKTGGETLRNNAIAKIIRESPYKLTRDEAYELWKQQLRAKASQGGKHKHPNKGFAHPNSNPEAAGQKGGRISRRRKKAEG